MEALHILPRGSGVFEECPLPHWNDGGWFVTSVEPSLIIGNYESPILWDVL